MQASSETLNDMPELVGKQELDVSYKAGDTAESGVFSNESGSQSASAKSEENERKDEHSKDEISVGALAMAARSELINISSIEHDGSAPLFGVIEVQDSSSDFKGNSIFWRLRITKN